MIRRVISEGVMNKEGIKDLEMGGSCMSYGGGQVRWRLINSSMDLASSDLRVTSFLFCFPRAQICASKLCQVLTNLTCLQSFALSWFTVALHWSDLVHCACCLAVFDQRRLRYFGKPYCFARCMAVSSRFSDHY